jgi:ABC-type nitrate/sulfonate/bicarbonate transport system permease component
VASRGSGDPAVVGGSMPHAAAQRRAAKGGGRRRRLGLQLASVALFFGLWQIVGMTTNPILFATPIRVAQAFLDLLATGKLQAVFPQSMFDLGVGYALAVVVGIGVGVAIGRSPTVEAILDPYVNFAMATPLIAVIPLLVVWVGIGIEARIATVFVLAVFKIIVNTAAGMKATPRVLREVASVYHLTRVQAVREIMLLNAVPTIFAGLRIALGQALIGMIIGELELAVTGLGGLIYDFGNQLRTDYLLAGICTASVVGVIAIGILAQVQARAFPWVAATTLGHQRG